MPLSRFGRGRKVERARAALRQRCADMVGQSLTGVHYVEGAWYDEELWRTQESYNSVEQAVELGLSSGQKFAVQWDDALVDFGLNVVPGRSTVTEGRYDVSSTSRWGELIGRTIIGCDVLWKPDDSETADWLPQTICIVFGGNRRVFLTASDFEREFDWGADHISVFFDDDWEQSGAKGRAHPSLDQERS